MPWRTGWRYSERALRHIYWDAGTMLAQALALASSAGLQPRLRTRFSDAEVSRLVGADGTHEFPVALVSLGDGAPAIEPTGDAAAGAVDTAPLEFPLVTLAQHAGDGDELGEPWPVGEPLDNAPASRDLDAVILQRGSTRRMDATATVSREVFEFSLAASLRGIGVPHFVAVHGVDGADPGLYRWPDLRQPLRREPLREELLRVCWDQDLGRDAAFVVLGATDLDRLDDRGYREAQLASGIVEGRLHLAAYALGIGASGMTFLDSEIEALLGEPLAALLFTCVGVPTYRNKGGGKPGEPASVVVPMPGLTPPPDLRRRDAEPARCTGERSVTACAQLDPRDSGGATRASSSTTSGCECRRSLGEGPLSTGSSGAARFTWVDGFAWPPPTMGRARGCPSSSSCSPPRRPSTGTAGAAGDAARPVRPRVRRPGRRRRRSGRGPGSSR